ncbi:hypothetical protein GCM10010399_25850 [Dactylosporangium fulvum]|uniref:Cytochrome P450 n=1 Tax=Dactylosporangium fulvum TaxID=53359 RepID=A0ABY5WBU5_9ACTN|nr:cytochrome P450 [Dactylosporangium fulvum]UWP86934.1 cytochrome P450 [Dactylosporangium fulvum]
MPVTPARNRQLGLFNLTLPAVIADPAQFYATLRTEAPVYFDPYLSTWLLSRHRDVQHLLAHPDTSTRMHHGDSLARFGTASLDEAFAMLDLHVSFVDGDDHRRLRRALAEPLQIQRVRTDLAEPITQAVTNTLLEMSDREVVDVVSTISSSVPTRVTKHLLDLDVDLETVQRWFNAWGDVVAAPGHVPTGNRKALLSVVAELVAYLKALVTRYEAQTMPPETMVGGLVSVMRSGGMTRDELIANLMMLVTAGTETTANLISNTIMTLADDPGLWALVNDRPQLIPEVVDEIARLHPPTQFTARRLLSSIELPSGGPLPAGASVVLMLAAANRDPQAFPDPDRVRIDRRFDRSGPRPLTFGHGAHYCFGAPLAQQETQLTIERLIERYTRITPLPGRTWRQNGNLRGLRTLPVRLVAKATKDTQTNAQEAAR